MRTLSELFDNNRKWASHLATEDPEFFNRTANAQTPEYLWIGCADSRVSASQIVGVPPGEIFVHRNIANVVVHTDLNCLAVVQYAVDVLKVKHIIVCGHYRCGGVLASLQGRTDGLLGNWLRHIGDIREKHRTALAAIADDHQRWDRLCEINTIEQVANICRTTIVRKAWQRGQSLSVHGWMYDLNDGLLHDMDVCVAADVEFVPLHRAALAVRGGIPAE